MTDEQFEQMKYLLKTISYRLGRIEKHMDHLERGLVTDPEDDDRYCCMPLLLKNIVEAIDRL